MELKEWRARQEEGEEYVTPSGLTVRVRRVTLLDLAEQGGIPTPLVGMVNKLLDTATHQLTVADVPEYIDAINLAVKAIIVDPPGADKADATHIAVSELPVKDRLALFNWASRAEALRPFRRATGGSTAS